MFLVRNLYVQQKRLFALKHRLNRDGQVFFFRDKRVYLLVKRQSAYLLYSLYSISYLSIAVVIILIGRRWFEWEGYSLNLSFGMRLSFGIIGVCIVPLCFMGWLRKHCQWIFVVLLCLLACLCEHESLCTIKCVGLYGEFSITRLLV